MAKASGNPTTGKRGTRKQARRDTSTTPLSSDGKNADKHRASQTFHRWAGENGRYLDHLTTIDMSFVATWKQGSRFENSFVLGVKRRPASGSCKRKERFSASKLANLQLFNVDEDESFPISSDDSESGTVQFNEQLRSHLERQSGNWEVNWSHASSSSSTDWWKLEKCHEPQQGEWQHNVDYSLFSKHFSFARILKICSFLYAYRR